MKLSGKIATALLLMVYVVAFVGFRLHECSLDHSVEVLLLADDSCKEVHHHNCSDDDHCGHHHHHCAEDHQGGAPEDGAVAVSEADCCENSVHCLSDAQLVPDDGGDDLALKCLPAAVFAATACDAQPAGPLFADVNSAAPRLMQGRTVLVLYSVRRV